jgi:hypothetical protein
MVTTNADRKILALGVKSAVFSAKELYKALTFLLKAINDGLKPMEQKNYIDFQNPGGISLLNVSPQQSDVQSFTELARLNDVNVSVKHSQDRGMFYLCLQGRQEDMKTAVTEYQKRIAEQAQTRSLSERLEQARQQTTLQAAERAHSQQRERGGRDAHRD